MSEKIEDRKKFYILIRKDVYVSIGKIMVHVGHLCTAMAWHRLCHDDRPDLRKKFSDWYFNSNQTKIILEVRDFEEMMQYRDIARMKHAFMTWQVNDAGYTAELKKGQVIMLGIEPLNNEEAKKVGLDKLSIYRFRR